MVRVEAILILVFFRSGELCDESIQAIIGALPIGANSPIYLTFPLLTTSWRASIVSSIGVFASKRWICRRSIYVVSRRLREASTALKIAWRERPIHCSLVAWVVEWSVRSTAYQIGWHNPWMLSSHLGREYVWVLAPLQQLRNISWG